VVNILTDSYKEEIRGRGLDNPNGLIELWTSKSNETYSIVLTMVTGQSCLISHGTDWEVVPVIGQQTND